MLTFNHVIKEYFIQPFKKRWVATPKSPILMLSYSGACIHNMQLSVKETTVVVFRMHIFTRAYTVHVLASTCSFFATCFLIPFGKFYQPKCIFRYIFSIVFF